MAKQIADFDFTRRGRKEKYPWDQWLAVGSTWELTRGEDADDEDVDFTCTPESLRTTIYSAAKKRGVATQTWIGEDKVVIRTTEIVAEDATEAVEVEPETQGYASV